MITTFLLKSEDQITTFLCDFQWLRPSTRLVFSLLMRLGEWGINSAGDKGAGLKVSQSLQPKYWLVLSFPLFCLSIHNSNYHAPFTLSDAWSWCYIKSNDARINISMLHLDLEHMKYKYKRKREREDSEGSRLRHLIHRTSYSKYPCSTTHWISSDRIEFDI